MRRWSVLIFILLLVVPTLELAVVMAVGSQIGMGWTIFLLVLESLLGAWIVKREGSGAWKALKGTFDSAGPPSKELADAALVLVGGTLLLTPGFLTDALGFFFVLPFTRPIARKILMKAAEAAMKSGKVTVMGESDFQGMYFGPGVEGPHTPGSSYPGSPTSSRGTTHSGDIIDGEVIDVDGPDSTRNNRP